MADQRDYKIRNIVRSVMSEVWAILPEKLEEIVEFLEARAGGAQLDESEIRARYGSRERSDDEGIQLLDGGIQVVDVFGTLAPRMNLMMSFSGGTSTQKLSRDLKAAASNSQVKTVILRVDSPGGAASYVPEAAAAVRELAQSKRVVASAENMAASGAYWIAAAADEFYASSSTQVGSIGVYSILQNMKEYYEKEGVKFTVLRAGDLKAAGNPYEELTAERKEALQSRVDAIYESFLSAVAEYRKTSMQTVEKRFGQGNVFLADEAQNRGMVDGVLTFEQVVAREQKSITTASVSVNFAERNMNPKLKAALFARGLTASLDADDATCQAAIASFRLVAGVAEDVSDEQLVDKILSHQPAQKPAAADKTPTPAPVADLAIAERERIQDIRNRGALLNVADEEIESAINSGASVSDALVEWTSKLAKENKPVAVIPGDSQIDKVARGASAVMLTRFSGLLGDAITEQDRRDAETYGSSFKHRSSLDMARTQLSSLGIRVTNDPIADAKAYLESAQIMTASVNRRGDHPDMLSNLANKALTRGAIIAQTTYQRWCAQIENLTDFKPKAFIDHGVFNNLDAIMEDGTINEMRFQSQIESWIKADRYANKVGLTVEMIVDDDLGGFARQLRSLGMASANTVQQAVLSLLNANPNMLDGNAFFSAAHNNIVASGSGGVPSATELVDHRRLHRLNTSFGTTRPMGANIAGILAPATLEENVLQTVATMYEIKTPATDATVNTFRGLIDPVIDANLDGYSTSFWYTFIPTEQAAGLVYAFQTGYGEQGLREDWYDNNTKTRYVSIETRFGVALSNYRAMVRNFGS